MKLLALVLFAQALTGAINVVAVGDSFTYGFTYPSGTQNPNNYPVLLLPMLKPAPWDNTVHNQGINGAKIGPKHYPDDCTMASGGCTMLDCLYVSCNGLSATKDLVQAGKTNILVVEGGIPDVNYYLGLGSNVALIPGFVHTSQLQLYSEAKALGFDIVIGMTTVAGGNNCAGPPLGNQCTFDGIRQGGSWVNTYSASYEPATCTCPTGNCTVALATTSLNDLLRVGHANADILIDLQSTTAVGLFGSFFDPYSATYRTCDGHWTTALNQVMANLVAAKINTSWIFPMGGAVNGGR